MVTCCAAVVIPGAEVDISVVAVVPAPVVPLGTEVVNPAGAVVTSGTGFVFSGS